MVVGVLQTCRDLIICREHVRLEQSASNHLLSDCRADIDVVRHVVLTRQSFDSFHLLCRRCVGAGNGVLHTRVLVAETLQNSLVVRPLIRKGDQVDLRTIVQTLLVESIQWVGYSGCRGFCDTGCRGLFCCRRSVVTSTTTQDET